MSAEKTKKTEADASVKNEAKTPAKAAAKSAAKPKAKAPAKTEEKVEVKAEHKTEHKTEHKVEHKAEHKTEHKSEAKTEHKTERKSEAKVEHKAAKKVADNYVPRLKKFYDSDVVKGLQSLYKYTTPMAIPRVVKVIINSGLGEATQDKTVIDSALEETTMIAAQKAVKTLARKSISNFHLREGMPIGVRVTLRGSRMYDFMDKFISIALPRVRDFKGLNPGSFDGRGNYTVGLKEQLVFPEIDYDKIKKIRGMDITIVTTAKNDEEAYQLLKQLGFPFKDK